MNFLWCIYTCFRSDCTQVEVLAVIAHSVLALLMVIVYLRGYDDYLVRYYFVECNSSNDWLTQVCVCVCACVRACVHVCKLHCNISVV